MFFQPKTLLIRGVSTVVKICPKFAIFPTVQPGTESILDTVFGIYGDLAKTPKSAVSAESTISWSDSMNLTFLPECHFFDQISTFSGFVGYPRNSVFWPGSVSVRHFCLGHQEQSNTPVGSS